MNSRFTYPEQPKICSKHNPHFTIQKVETPDHHPDLPFDQGLYTIEWSDIENIEMDYENYLNDIESFFREDFENDILGKDSF
ncbi:hypothetical protein [Chryseobacterium sp.]|uniref:hypothetical protein n=1 Tax=Chryseobacterium sp. TaxID=1871047 RepID=UPI0031D3816A